METAEHIELSSLLAFLSPSCMAVCILKEWFRYFSIISVLPILDGSQHAPFSEVEGAGTEAKQCIPVVITHY